MSNVTSVAYSQTGFAVAWYTPCCVVYKDLKVVVVVKRYGFNVYEGVCIYDYYTSL